jgi:hypothetical protein
MSETFDNQLTADLDLLVPLTSTAPNWSDVEHRAASLTTEPRRAHTSKQRRRPHLGRPLLATVILALLLSGAAYAVVRYVIIGSPAPPQIKVSEQALERAEASLDVFGPDTVGQVDLSYTRAEGILTSRSGR